MPHNALAANAQPTTLFDAGHPLRALVRPTFDSVRARMGRHLVSCIWMDTTYYPERAGYRVSYDEIYGPGSTNVMPFIATYLSTGPGSGEAGNVVVLPRGIDQSLVGHAVRTGLLGPHRFIGSAAELRQLVTETGRKLYSIDDMGPEFGDEQVVVTPALSRLLNAKDALGEVSAYAPREIVGDMYDDIDVDTFGALHTPGRRVFVKTCNTEAAGAGVFVCESEADFSRHLAAIRARQRQHALSRVLVVQPEITGRNRSFQIHVSPDHPAEIQVITITDQLVEADGKTYAGSVNHPATAATLDRVGPVIIDLVARVRAKHPDLFGIVMCDYFEDEATGEIVIYDPGVRPSGNTATAMSGLLGQKLAGRELYTSNFPLRTDVTGLTFERFVRATGDLTDPDRIAREHVGILPWGWNPQVGFGMLIGLAPSRSQWEALRDEVTALRF